MAWYDVNYSCGHKGRLNLIGPGRDRESRIAWLEKEGLALIVIQNRYMIRLHKKIMN